MIEDSGFYNVKNAKALLYHLIESGVEHFCMSPGSRSTPLVLALNCFDKAKKMVHFDERGMAFLALGIAKASNKPVALFVTSGTAVANLFPAVMEAHATRTPLIIITADRPQEKLSLGSNQTVDQAKIFSTYVHKAFDLSFSDPFITEKHLSGIASYAAYSKGPVHINCQFREPLFSSKKVPDPILKATHYEKSSSIPTEGALKKWGQLLSSKTKGVIVLGANALNEEAIFMLGEKLKWPILIDVLSQSRQKHSASISYYNLLLEGMEKPECILHLGDVLVSKHLQEYLKAPHYLLVADHSLRHDPLHAVTHRLECAPSLFCEGVLPYIEPQNTPHFFSLFKEREMFLRETLENYFNALQEITEPSIFWELQKKLKYPVFLPNSMPIRDADTFFFPDAAIPIFANRGVSGIDGNIATAAGIAEGLKSPILAIFGDVAALHDLNSLALIKKSKYPIICLIINNQGGGIFSFLPIAERTDLLEDFFATAHSFDFEHAARFFDLPYSNELSKCFENPVSQIIEIKTNRKQNVSDHQEIKELCIKMPCYAEA